MKRTLGKLILVALGAFALAACQTAPAKPEPAPVVQQSTIDLMLAVRKAELEIERTEQMAWLKFAAESKSDLAKGFVMGRSKGAAPASSSSAQTILQAQAQADETALRREELAERNNPWNRGLQVFDRSAQLFMFSKGLSFQRYSLDAANSQERYRLGTMRGTQQDAYGFSSGAYSAGSTATLNGFTAARQPAPSAATTSTTAPTE